MTATLEIRGRRPEEKRMNESKTPSGAAVPCIDLLGLSVHHKEDGCWIVFKASNGCQAAINLTEESRYRSPIIRRAILQWIEDVRPNAPLERTAVAGTLGGVVGVEIRKDG